ncbi:VWA domain-containing protein, partial [bacterium]|nr:VWA domain-containing protein [bacterium]
MALPGYPTIDYPEALLLGAVLVWLYLRVVRIRNLWRGMLLVAGILLLAYPSLVRSTESVDLFVLADRSRSISEEGRAKEMEIIDLLLQRARPGDRVGIVSFNQRAYLERPLSEGGAHSSFNIPYSEDASDLDEGLALVLSQIVRPERARVLVLSDGQYTGPDPMRQAQMARQNGAPIFYRDLVRAELYNLAVRDVVTPDKLLAGEPFRVVFKVHATTATRGRYRLLRDGHIVGRPESQGWREHDFSAGENQLEFRDVVEQPGLHGYRLEVETIPRERETLLSDNEAERYVEVVGERPLLLVNHTGRPDNVSRVLSAGRLAHHVVAVERFRMSIEELSGYSGVILNNAPVLGLTLRQLEGLRDFVTQEGGGLVVLGGNRSFAAGGYYKSALEPILPVSLEDRQQSKKVSTA